MKGEPIGFDRALFWTLVFAVFAAVAAGLGARVVDRLATGYQEAATNYAVVRVIAPEGPYAVAAAQVALSEAPHVSSAAPMTRGRAAALLRNWGGAPANADELPDLSLIELELAPATPGADVAGDIVAALAQAGVTAEVIEAPADGASANMAARVRTIASWGAVAFGAVMAVIVWLAARGLATRRRELVTVMCDLGATRAQAASRIGDEAAMLGLSAGGAGAVLAVIVAVVLLLLAAPEVSLQALPAMIRPLDFAPLVAAPMIAALAAGLGARAAAGDIHAQAARLG
ncbi:MAG: hypothetical protein K2P58_15380 [Hyphomonadaceae bacterium]|nr:hypothetical protein [Hyphomonadaceae bacterium]